MVVRIAAVLTVAAGITTLALSSNEPAGAADRRQVERGKALVWSVGCNDCHTPKKMGPNGPELDEERLLYGRLPDEDLKAIYAYLRSIPPVHNRVPQPVIADAGADQN
jgi:mono/diheme cytochrome c family protein